MTPASMARGARQRLKRIGTDYLDLYQLHWPNRGHYHFRQAWSYNPTGQDTGKVLDDLAASWSARRLRKTGRCARRVSNDTPGALPRCWRSPSEGLAACRLDPERI